MLSSILLLCLAQEIPPKPPIVSRAEWRAKPMLPGAIPHVVQKITIHHTGVKSNRNRSLEDKLAGLQAFSQREDKLANGKTKPAWPDVPYHYYIAIDGRIGEGRDPNFQGDTNTEYSPKGHLLIVVEGEFNTEKPTQEQLGSLVVLTRWCCWRYHVSADQIAGHGDYSKQTDCPGDNLKPFLPILRKECAQ